MAEHEEYQTALGMTPSQIAETLWKDVSELLPQDQPAWKDLDSNLRARWSAGVEVLFIKVERKTSMPAKLATQSLVDSIYGEGAFKKMARPKQIVFEALLRKAVNLIQAGTMDDPTDRMTPAEQQRELEQCLSHDWKPWIVEKLQQEKLA